MSDGTFTPAWLEHHRVAPAARVTESSIVGIGHVLDEVRSLLGKLSHPEIMASLGAEPPRGILLHGQPGTGKTLVARFIASSLGADVPMYELSADELTPARVRKLFAHLAATHERCVLYIDEIDLVAMNRRFADPDANKILVALLAALDGMRSEAGPILLASSNRHPGMLDPALMRPGRIGVHIPFDLPNEAEREALFRYFMGNRPKAGDIDYADLAVQAADMTPAEIRSAVDDATGLALADGRMVTCHADLRLALRRRGVVLPEELAAADPVELHRTAIHEAGHVIVALALRGPTAVTSVAIQPDGGETTLELAGRPSGHVPAAELRDAVVVGYGGIAAEEEVYGSAATGATDDVQRATTLACMLARVGQLDGAQAIDYQAISNFTGISAPDAAVSIVTAMLAGARKRASDIVRGRSLELRKLAQALAQREGIVTGDALRTVLIAAGLVGHAGAEGHNHSPATTTGRSGKSGRSAKPGAAARTTTTGKEASARTLAGVA